MMLRSALNRLTAPLRRARGGDVMEGSRAASTTPLCREYGYSRGTPIDRHYIEAFLERHSSDIRDRVLEIGDDTYSRRFGSHRITQQDILHVHPGHPRATIVGDVAEPGVLPQKAFDCIILTQVLHLIFDMNRAVEQIPRGASARRRSAHHSSGHQSDSRRAVEGQLVLVADRYRAFAASQRIV